MGDHHIDALSSSSSASECFECFSFLFGSGLGNHHACFASLLRVLGSPFFLGATSLQDLEAVESWKNGESTLVVAPVLIAMNSGMCWGMSSSFVALLLSIHLVIFGSALLLIRYAWEPRYAPRLEP